MQPTMRCERITSGGDSLPPLSQSRGVFISALAGFACFTIGATAAWAEVPDGLDPLKQLKIDNGSIVLLERQASPTMTTADNRTINKLAPRTILKLALHPAKGSNINVEMWLPDAVNWNSKLLGLGNGGSAGHINSSSLAGPLSAGFAVVTTDMGTAPDSNSGVGNPEVWKDFGFRATHLMTVVGKQVVKSYYGKDATYCYFNGGSTGGQQALQEAQRYPQDYDGIVANVPAHCRTPLHAYFLWNDQILTKCPFTRSQQEHVIAAGNEFAASRETAPTAGKMVSDPRCSDADIEAVIALAMRNDPSLTKEHADALRKLFSGPRHAVTGERIFNGIPFGSSLDASHGHLYLFKWVFGADKDTADINFGTDIDRYTAALAPYLNAENDDLSTFEKRGGKMIMLSGSADSVVPYHATLDYYERVAERFGDIGKVRSFFRFYIVPGMSHGPGPGINNVAHTLDLVIQWRETGNASMELRGKRVIDGKTELDMPLYPYPDQTGWDAATGQFKRVEGRRGGVDRVTPRFRPQPTE